MGRAGERKGLELTVTTMRMIEEGWFRRANLDITSFSGCSILGEVGERETNRFMHGVIYSYSICRLSFLPW